ncbi:hypothetical protein OH773_13075 [Buttiauxella sp. WJP83]|uniref:glycine-rich domain-containing protein n=1 Tax=Buttiauxella sp. WJP83 TaxID=2986951 RepID=UPI0022DDB78D|nr:hypothetical protein [Buttiauxella sp. WJP83]WBM69119.1 hypothetical protein OH773_13075 [Buttiauxella sp. WJP83]
MHRIDTPTAQKDKFGAGKNGFTRGNPQTGTQATDLDDDYFDAIQEELAGVVEATGISLDKAKRNQLLTALKALLLSRAHPFADIKADGAAAVAEALTNLGLINGSGYSGRLSGVPKLIATSGTYTTPSGVKALIVEVIGAGAGGGGTLSATAGAHSVTGGGGAGGTAVSFIANPVTTYNVTIGAGGKSGTTAGTSGTDGGTTSFGSVAIATGGTGGTGGTTTAISQTNAIVAAGGNAGKGTVGNIRCGSNESAGVSVGTNYGNISSGGGSTPYGTGGMRVGLSVKGNQPGFSATGYGAGGSGAISIDAGGAAAGGDGSDGCVLVWELY